MRASRTRCIIAALVAPFAAGACSQATTAGGTQPATTQTDGSLAELEALYEARTDSARMHFTEADVRFMTGMIHHHAQALEIARLAPTHTTNSSLQTLAARIINAQQGEIALMQQWLRDRDQPVPEVHGTETDVMVHGADHAIHMPGMLTAEQIQQLGRTRGPAFDPLFLTLMIQHHRGAVTMVRDLFATDGAGQDEEAFRLASDVHVDQVTEIARMELMLSTLADGEATS